MTNTTVKRGTDTRDIQAQVSALTPAQRFFFQHAGFSYDPKVETQEQGKIRGAIELARAEQYAKDHDWTYEWDGEQDVDLSWMTDEERAEPHEVLCCILWDGGDTPEVLEALGNIVDADRNYGRVIEAELALEALHRIETEEQNARECAAMLGEVSNG